MTYETYEPGDEITSGDEDWRTTPQEHVMDNIYEASKNANEGFRYDIFGVTDDRPEAVIYVEDPDGNCWELIAKRHIHRGEHNG